MSLTPTMFADEQDVYLADTCAPLSHAVAEGKCKLNAWVHGAYPGKAMPHGLLSEICSVGYWDVPTLQDWGLEMHRNEGIEITYLERGQVDFSVGNQNYRLKPGDLTITRPWQPHRVGNPHVEACQLHWIILDVGVRHPHTEWNWPDWLLLSQTELRELTDCLRGNEQHVLQGVEDIAECFRSLKKIVDGEHAVFPETRLKLSINELMFSLNEVFKRQNPALDSSLSSARRTVKMFLDELPHNLSSDWTLDTMAKRCGLARSRFNHYCKEITNQTSLAYLSYCRLEAAKKILVSNMEKRIGDIALECGFYSNQYFSSSFRKYTSMTPQEYRLSHAKSHTPL